MGASGNPAKKAAAKKQAASASVSSISAFKEQKKGKPLELPSGLVVKARRVELQTFIMKGDVPNPLMSIVGEALEKGQKADIASMVGVDEGKIDLDMVNDMYEMVNAVVCQCIVEPQVHPVPEDEDDRDDDLLYVDEVDDEDKMFIFQWSSGGTSDLATFREEARAGLASVAKKQGAKNPAKRSGGTKAK